MSRHRRQQHKRARLYRARLAGFNEVASAVNEFLASLKDAPPPIPVSAVTYCPVTMRLTVTVPVPFVIRDEDLCR